MRVTAAPLTVRWTVGNVTDQGFEALALSVRGATRLFGPDTRYVVYVNSCSIAEARSRTGDLPRVQWQTARHSDLPPLLKGHLDSGLAEGVGWKFAPLRADAGRHELALDNDCILWSVPPSVRRWLASTAGECLLAEDVRPCFGQFADLCGAEPRNTGIRGLPRGFDLEEVIHRVLRRRGVVLGSETDEQGLQVAALSLARRPLVVSTRAVTICSPFYTHQQHLGECGAHFVGINARTLPWDYYGRPAVECLRDHWRRLRPAIEARVRAAGRTLASG